MYISIVYNAAKQNTPNLSSKKVHFQFKTNIYLTFSYINRLTFQFMELKELKNSSSRPVYLTTAISWPNSVMATTEKLENNLLRLLGLLHVAILCTTHRKSTFNGYSLHRM